MNKFWKYKADHILFWAVTIGFHIYTRIHLIDQAGVWQFLLEIIFRNGLLAFVIYTNFQYLIPLLVQEKKTILYFFGLALTLGLYVVAKNTHDVYLHYFISTRTNGYWGYSFYNFSIALFYLSFSLALQLSKEWFFQREKLRQMEIEKLNTELEYLKSQMNPHFLFNSLNTIFFQIDKTNLPARETLTKFADMLRFQLYECNGQEIALEKEIKCLKNYIDLQRLRKDEKYQIEFSTSGDWRDFAIAPLLLMPLAENAFKHVSHHREGDNKIFIAISCNSGRLEATVRNTKEDQRLEGQETGGIGLKNLKRRLELQYPDRHTLEIQETKEEFGVKLTVNAKP